MVTDFLSAPFLQNACNRKAAELLTFKSSSDDPSIEKLSCNGTITIESIKDGAPVTATYSNLNMQRVEISADADTTITIRGKVTVLDFLWYNDDPNVDDYEGNFYDLTVIDLTQASSLTELTVAQQESLDELILSGNKKLTKLDCSDTGLTALDLATNTQLQYLAIHGCTGLTSLDLATNTQLQYLVCNGTGLTSLDLATNTQLQYLDCNNCTGLTSLNLATNTQLQYLKCAYTGLTSLDLATNTQLQYLAIHGCTGLTSLDLATNTQLQYLNCNNCTGLTALDLTTNVALQYLNCTECTAITEVKYSATNSDVSDAIAGAITAATAADGTVYTDSAGAYYSTIADAATAKGWTIAQL